MNVGWAFKNFLIVPDILGKLPFAEIDELIRHGAIKLALSEHGSRGHATSIQPAGGFRTALLPRSDAA